MSWNDIAQYIRPETGIIAAALWVIGFILKKYPKFKSDWCIPFILLAIGVVLTPVYMLFVEKVQEGIPHIIVAGVIQGVLAVGLATLFNEGKKQIIRGRKANRQGECDDE